MPPLPVADAQSDMEKMEADARPGPVVEKNIGCLPSLWDRSAVFVANMLSMFFGNRRETEVLREHVGSLETYGGRLIPITDLLFRGGENLLVLEGKPDRVLCTYFEDVLGLSVPKVEVGSHRAYSSLADGDGPLSEEARQLVEAVKASPAEYLDGFVTDEALVQLAEMTGKKLVAPLEASRVGNNKLLLHEFLISEELPIFDTILASVPAEVPECITKLASQGYRRGVIKAQVGASGIGMMRVDFDEPLHVPDYLFHEGACLVQGWLEAGEGTRFLGSPSVQIFIHDDHCCLYDITDQILSGASVHEGNMAPPPHFEEFPHLKDELLRQGERAALWLHEHGYRGTASADFHVMARGQDCEVRLCEINARVTGATYPSLLARHFRPNGAWLMRNVRFAQPYSGQLLLDALDDACLLYRAGGKSGILPINFNLTRDGFVFKGQFVAIGADVAEVRHLFDCIHNLGSFLWEYDRD